MKKKIVTGIVAVGFLLYLTLIFYMLFRGFGRKNIIAAGQMQPNYAYNLIPFKTILQDLTAVKRGSLHALRNLSGNLFLFSPLGFFWPILTDKLAKGKAYAITAFLLIGGVELTQLVTRTGSFDVDDILLNFFGAMLGFAVCRGLLFARWRKKKKG